MRADGEPGLRPLLEDLADHAGYADTERLVRLVRQRAARHNRRRVALTAMLVLGTVGGAYLVGRSVTDRPAPSGHPAPPSAPAVTCPARVPQVKQPPPVGTPPAGPLPFTPTVGVACRYAGLNDLTGGLTRARPVPPATLATLPGLLNGREAAQGAYPCPFDDGGIDMFVLSAPGRPALEITVHRSGCGFVGDGRWSWFPAPDLTAVLDGLLDGG